MDDSGDLPHSLQASAASILSNLRKKQQAMLAVGSNVGVGVGSGAAINVDRPVAGAMAKQTPRRVQSVRIVEDKSGYGPKRRTESCSIFGNSNFGKPNDKISCLYQVSP